MKEKGLRRASSLIKTMLLTMISVHSGAIALTINEILVRLLRYSLDKPTIVL